MRIGLLAIFAVSIMGLAAARAGDDGRCLLPPPLEFRTDFEPGDDQQPGVDACRLAKIAGSSLPATPTGASGGIAGFADPTDVLHYDLDLEIVPASTWIGGSCTMTVRANAAISSFSFRLSDSFTISAVKVDNVDASWTRLDPINVSVSLGGEVQENQIFTLSVSYNGVPVSGGSFGSILFQNRGNPPVKVFYTLSEPWYAYTWWPCKDDNNDKATGSLRFVVPNTYSVASNGLLVTESAVDAARTQFIWQTDYEMAPYLFSMAGANYVRFDGSYTHLNGVMPLRFFIYPDSNTTNNRNRWLQTATMLDTFGSLYGIYPFLQEKYGVYQFGFNGGQEHQTMTGQGTFNESVTAHELSHQWWGDMITCATWSDIWLNEGFATYSEALWNEFKPGSTGHAALLASMASRRPSAVDDTVYIANPTSINRIFSRDFSYLKGGWVLHQLRHIVGDTAFFDILATYRQAYQYGTATTAEFQAVCEAVAGRELDWFFNEWVYLPGAPQYEYATRTVDVNGLPYLELYVSQVQSASFPTFSMPIDVNIVYADLSQQLHVIWNFARAQHFLFPATQSILGTQFDPEDFVLNIGKTTIEFVEGPPKIVVTSPAPGAKVEDASVLSVTFHKAVVFQASDFTLSGANTGDITISSVDFDSGTLTATISTHDDMPPDQYTLTVADSLTDERSGLRLDGELSDPASAAPLPSGDGVPGGEAVIHFTVTLPLVAGDLNCDGAVNNFDIDPFVLALTDASGYSAAFPLCNPLAADVSGDGVVNNFDIDPFVNLLVE